MLTPIHFTCSANPFSDYNIGVSKGDYEDYLLQLQNDKPRIELLKRNTHKGLFCGSDDFIARLGKKIGRNLVFRGNG